MKLLADKKYNNLLNKVSSLQYRVNDLEHIVCNGKHNFKQIFREKDYEVLQCEKCKKTIVKR